MQGGGRGQCFSAAFGLKPLGLFMFAQTLGCCFGKHGKTDRTGRHAQTLQYLRGAKAAAGLCIYYPKFTGSSSTVLVNAGVSQCEQKKKNERNHWRNEKSCEILCPRCSCQHSVTKRGRDKQRVST